MPQIPKNKTGYYISEWTGSNDPVQRPEGFWSGVGQFFQGIGGFVGGLAVGGAEDLLEWVGLDDEETAWFPANRDRGEANLQGLPAPDEGITQEGINKAIDEVESRADTQNIVADAVDLVEARNQVIEQKRSFFSVVEDYEAKNSISSVVHSFWNQDVSETYGKSTLRDRGVAGIFGQ